MNNLDSLLFPQKHASSIHIKCSFLLFYFLLLSFLYPLTFTFYYTLSASFVVFPPLFTSFPLLLFIICFISLHIYTFSLVFFSFFFFLFSILLKFRSQINLTNIILEIEHTFSIYVQKKKKKDTERSFTARNNVTSLKKKGFRIVYTPKTVFGTSKLRA